MTGKSVLLMLLETAVGVAIWIFGWPILRDIQTAFNWIAAVIVIAAFLGSIVLAVLVWSSQRQPPYA
jgi:hypothetical protein